MEPHEEQTERYLKEFRPRAIRELQFPPQTETNSWRRRATVLALAACAGGILWLGLHQSARRKETETFIRPNRTVIVGQQQHPSTFALTSLALQDERKFNSLLIEKSRTSLPNFQGEHSSLKVLAQE